jgi:biotin transport system substrate-specific component
MMNSKNIATTQYSFKKWDLLFQASFVFAYALATSLSSQLKFYIPGTIVPVTLQLAVVLLSALHLGARKAAIAQVLYLFGATYGLFSFATKASTLSLIGPTGGYLWGFVVAALVLGSLKSFAKTFVSTWILTFAVSLIVLGLGMVQFKVVLGLDWTKAFSMGVAPFLIGDLLKVTLVAMSYRTLSKN